MFHTRLARRAMVAVVSAALAVVVTASPAFAHTSKTVGTYQLTLGWQHEPSYTGVENAVQLFVHDATGKPIDNLGTNGLKVQVVFNGTSSSPFDLTGSFDPDTGLGQHGEFDAAITPTQPGDYTFHFTGDINGQKIDESFTSSPTTFDSAKNPTNIEFPTKNPTPAELSALNARLSSRVDSALAKANSASNSVSTAQVVAIVALVLGALGLVAGVGAIVSRRRPAP